MESFSHNRFSRLFSLIIFGLLLLSMFAGARVASATPNFSAAFSPTTIGPGATSALTLTIDNSANSTGFSSVAFSATLPAGMTVSTNSAAQTTCNSAILSATGGGNSISFSDGRIGSNQTCTVTMDVTSSTAGTHTLTTGDLTSSGGNSGTATANLTVDAGRPGFSMAFSPSTVSPNQISTLTYTIDNTSNGSNADRLKFTHTLPTGLLVATNPNTASTCVGGVSTPTVTTTAGTDSIAFTFGYTAAGASCTAQVDVISASSGVYETTTGALTQNGSNSSGPASAELTVSQPFMNAYFASDASPGQSLALTFEITNTDRNNAISGLSFTDDLNAALTGLAATALPANGFCGSGSSMTGSSSLSVSGVSLATGESCSFAVTVLVPANAAAGNYTNTTSTINLTLGSATTSSAVTNTLVVKKAPTLTVSFIDGPALAGGDVTGRFIITNTDTTNSASAIAFNMYFDTVVTGLVIKTLPAANSCGSGSTFTSSVDNSNVPFLKVSSGALSAGANCQFDVVFTAALDSAPGTYTFTTEFGSATVNGSTLTVQKASANLQVTSAPSLSLAVTESIAAGGSVTLNFSLNHSANSSGEASAIGFTVDLNAALTGLASTSATQNDICGSGSQLSGTSTLTFSGGTLATDASCDFSITAAVPSDAAPATITITSSNVSATVSSTSVSSSTVSDTFIVTGLTLSHSFVTNPVLPGRTSIVRYVIANNAAAPAATALQFSHRLSQALSSLSATALPSNPCGASSSMSGATSLTFSGGELQPGTNCTFDVTVTIPTSASEGIYTIPTSEMSATVNVSGTDTNTVTSASSATLTVETLSVTLSSTAGSSTSVSPIPVKITFNRAITGLADADFTVTNGTASGLSGSDLEYTVNITPTADGAVTVQLPANAVDDSVDATHKNPASNQLSIAYSATSSVVTPTLVITSPSSSSTKGGPVTYGVTYTNADQISLAASSITLNKTSTATATVTVTSGSTSTPTVTLSSITGDGTLGISIAAETARSDTNGVSAAAGPSTTFTVDNTKPTVTITDAVADSVNTAFTATFTISEAVTDFIASDVTVSNASLTAFSATSSTVYTALITPTTEGSVTIDVAAGVATDSVGNTNSAATQHSVTYDTTSPTAVISGPTGPVNAAFTATITFSEDVTGFAQSDISAGNANLSSFAATSASVYTVTVTPTAQGNVTLDVGATTAIDAAQNSNTAAAQYAVSYDSVQPSVTISGSTDPVNAAFTATITFTEDVTGFVVGDISATNASLSNFSSTSSAVYTVLVTPTGQGSVTLDVVAAVAADSASNTSTAATQFSVVHDSEVPTVTISGPSAPTNATSFTATITFNEDVTGFVIGDVTASNGSLDNFSATSASVYTVDVTPTNQGNVTLDIAADAAIDSASNGNTAATQFLVEFDTVQPTIAISGPTTATNAAFTATFTFSEDVTGFVVGDIVATNASLASFAATDAKIYTVTVTPTSESSVTLNVAAGLAIDSANNSNTVATEYSVIYDTTSPTVAITGSSTPVNAAFTATITFNEDVTDFVEADISASNASLSDFVTTSASVYMVTVTPSTEGNVTLDVAASVATDTAGNNNIAATQYVVLHDSVAPTVSITGPTTPTNSAFTATITFSEDVTGFDSSDISVNNATLSSVGATSAAVYTVQVTPATQGNVTLDIAASAAIDSATNGNTAATQFSVLFDTVQPTVSISGAATITNAAFTATFTFNEDVTGFAVEDIVATNASLTSFASTDAKIYTVQVTPTAEGNVTLNVAAAVAADAAGNNNSAATEYSVLYDITSPTVTISGSSAPVNTSFTATITFSEDVSDFVVADITASNASLSDFVTTSASAYMVTVTPSTEGNVTLDVAAAVATDAASNNNIAATQYVVLHDSVAPTVSITGPTTPTNSAFTATITFSEDVTGFDSSDISVSNATLSSFSATSAAIYTVQVTPATQGNVTLDIAASAAIDSATNGNTAATQYSVLNDSVQPTLTISGQTTPVNAAFITTFTFNEDVTGFAMSDISATNSVLSSFNSTSASVYTVVVTPASEGSVTLDVAASAAVDSANNGNVAATQFTVNYDPTAPTVVISGSTTPVNAAFTATFTFSEDVTGFEMSDVTASNASLSNFNSTSSSIYTATVTPISDGNVALDVANNVAVDSASNSNSAAAQYSISYDTSQPTLNVVASANLINAAYTATFTFSETVTGFEIGDIIVTNGNASNLNATSGAVYSATITPASEGSVAVDVAAGVATDVAGNLNTAATQSTTTYDITSPTVTLSADSAFMQTTKTVTFTFSEDVTGFALTDIGVTNGTAGSFTSVSSQVYTAVITASSEGTVSINVPASVALDTAGNANVSSNVLNLTSDTTAPTLSVSTPTDNSNSFGVSSNIQLQFSESVSFNTTSTGTLKVIRLSDSNTIAESTDLTLSSGTVTGQGTGTISSTTLTIDLTQNLTAGANYAVQMSAEFLLDSAGNAYAGISNLTDLNFVTMPSVILTVDRTQLIEEQLQTATATVSLQGPSSQAFSTLSDVTIAMSFSGSTATSGTDYTVSGLNSGSITISSGTSQSSFTMTTINDSPLADEPEQIVVSVDSVTTNNAVEVLEQQVTVSIVENAAPEATNVPTSITIVEDVKTNIDLSSVTVTDSEGDNLVLTLTLSNGTLNTITGTSNGATVTRVSDLSATVAGTISAINTLLDDQTAFAIIPPQNSTDSLTLSLSVSDGTETGPTQTIPVTITPVNDTPSLVSGSEDTFDVTGGTISSATSYTETQGTTTMTVTLDTGNLVSTDLDTKGGTSGVSLYTDTATTNQVTVAFSEKVNLESAVYFFNTGSAPNNITITPTGDAGSALTLASSDFTVDNVGTKVSFSGWTGITQFVISSTDGSFAPGLDTIVFSPTPSNLSFQEDVQTSLDLSSLSLSDDDSTSMSLIISANQGTLALPTSSRPAKNGNSSVIAAIATLADNVITVTGTAAEINSFLSVVGNVLYTPAANSNGSESAMITVSVNDNDGSGAVVLQTILLDVTAINDAPEIANLNSDTVTFTQGGSAVNIDSQSNAVATDVDHTNLDGGSLTVSIASGGDSSEDVLSFSGSNVSLGGTASGSNVSVNSEVVGTLGNAISEGNILVVNLSSNATLANVGSLLNAITYFNSDITNPTTSNRTISVQISDGDLQSDAAITTVSFVPLDNSSDIDVTSRFSTISSLANSLSSQIALVLQAADEGTDGVATTITGINFSVGGTLNADNMSFSLRQVQISDGSLLGTFQGQYSNGVLNFSDSISIPNGSSDISLQLNVWFDDNTNLSENDNITFSINPGSDVTVSNTGSQLGTIAAQPDTSLVLSVDATIFDYVIEPSGSISGLPLSVQPIVSAEDSFGNLDLDFTGVVELTEFSAGSLSNNTVQASAGVATFTGLTYSASSDNESFVLAANVVSGTAQILASVSSDFLNSDVVATRVSFITEPSPNSLNSDTLTQFTTVPVLGAQNADGLIDQDYNESVVISEINGPGVANINVTGDIDSLSSTATLAFSSGAATFTGFEINYTAGGEGNESFNLSASSGTLSSATSQVISVNDLPVLEGAPAEISVSEDVVGDIDLSSLVLVDSDGNDQTLSLSVSSGTVTIDEVAAQGNSILASGSGTNSVSIAGSVSGLQAFLNLPAALTYLTDLNDDTDATLTILANDGQVDSALISISIAITPINDVPVITGDGAESLTLGDTYDFTPAASDVDNTTLVFSVVNLPEWLSFDEETGRLFGVADRSAVGISENIIISVSDAESISSLEPFNIDVFADNSAPVITGSPSPTILQEQLYSFTPDISDIDGDSLTITIENRPDWLTFNSQDGSLNGTPGNDNVGLYSDILLSVSDGQFSANLGPFSIEVLNVNDAPEISGTPASQVEIGVQYSFVPDANDIDGDDLTFQGTGIPEWLALNPDTGELLGIPQTGQDGLYENIVITVFDQQLSASLAAFSINVIANSGTPTVENQSLTVDEDTAIDITLVGNDINGDTLSYRIVESTIVGTLLLNENIATYTPPADVFGITEQFSFIANDGQFDSEAGLVSISILPVNDAPTISGEPDSNVKVLNNYSFTPQADDVDDDSLTYSIVNAPAWTQFDTLTGTLSGQPQVADTGLYGNILISVKDQELSASLQSFSIEVLVNTPPDISGSPAVVAQVSEIYSFTPQVSDLDEDTLTFSVSNMPSWLSFNTETGTLTGTPVASNVGIFNAIQIFVSDGINTVSLPSFDIRVCEVCDNQMPSIGGSPDEVIASGNSYSFEPQASDPDGDTLVFSIENRPTWAAFDSTLGRLTGIPVENDVGVYRNIVIRVSDNQDTAALPSFDIEVTSSNSAPDISGNPEITTFQGELYQFTPTASDSDGDNLIFSIGNRPQWAAFNPQTGRLSGTPVAQDVGTYSNIFISVTDNVNESVALSAFNVEVIAKNSAPEISGAPRTSVRSGIEYLFEPTAFDFDGDALTFSIVNLPDWLVFDEQSGRLSGIASGSNVGEFTGIVISVSDSTESVSLTEFSITVESDNSAPVVQNLDISVDEDKFVNIATGATDSNQDELSFTVLTPTNNGSLVDTSNGWRYTPNENFNGSDSFIFEASDGQLQSEPATVSILVNSVNDKPVAEDDTISLDQVNTGTYLIDVLANDIDVDVETNQDVITLQRVSTNFGTATVVDNQVQLEVNQSFFGNVDLNYSIRDEDAKNDTAKVSLTINGVDNVNAPVITLDAEVVIDATGLSTKVDFGDVSAVDADGETLPVSLVDDRVNFAPGLHTVYWQAEDSFGTTTIEPQSIVVNPIISIDASEFVVEGTSTTVRVLLNGDAPSYPFDVSYELTGNAESAGVDYSVTGGTSGVVTFNDGTEQNFAIEALNDNEIEGDENITLTLSSGQNISGNGSANIIISESNVAPSVALEMFQSGELRTTVAQDEGVVSIVATVTEQNIQDTVTIQWTADNIVNQSISDEIFEFDPNEVAIGFNNVAIYVNDDGDPILDSTNSVDFEIVNTFIVLSDTEDTDGDLIPDAQEGFGDSDGDGIPNYLDAIEDCNVIAAQAENQSEFLIESDPAACMRQGETSGQNESNGLQVVTVEVAGRQTATNKRGERVTLIADNLPEDSGFENIGGVYDFIMYGLPQLGQSARVVIPQTVPVSEGAIYRKYNTNSERWDSFARDDNNQLFSFSGERGICPAPGSESWQTGLIPGSWCVQLTIEDGGLNDDDQIADGTIKYLGGVAIFTVDNTSPQAQNDQLEIQWNSEVEINVLDNDSDPDNDVLTLLRASANIGDVSIVDETRILYVSSPGYSGTDVIEYIVSDGNGGSANASVTLTIVGNRAPGAVDDFAETDHRTVIEIDVLQNDIDVDNDELSIINAMAEFGDVAITPQNTLSYTPKISFSGLDSVNYEVQDEVGATDSATVSVFVNGNEAPVANNDSGNTAFQTPININVIANDSDPDGDELMVIDASATSGSVSVGDDYRITFTPAANFTGSVIITYTVSDGILTATGTVTIDVAKNIVETNVSNKSGGAMPLMLLFGLLLLIMSRRRLFNRV